MQEALKKINPPEVDDQQFLDDVVTGLSQPQKALHPKYFYDRQGSKYFDEICQLEEYYPYRTELSLLPQVARDIRSSVNGDVAIVEFGAGSLLKIKPLLQQVTQIKSYVPIDISGEHLRSACRELKADYPEIKIKPIVADFTRSVSVDENRAEQRLGFFPGSTIGNFKPSEALSFLHNARTTLGVNSRLLIGVDTKKSPRTLHDAYNDSQDVTARFNLNILHRINRELGGSFDIAKFEHYAFYNAGKGCIEMHLVCMEDQSASVGGFNIEFAAGESIHTESSYKYTPKEFKALAQNAGWRVERFWLADGELFSVYLLC